MSLIGETQPQAAAGDLIKDGTDASFVADVIEQVPLRPDGGLQPIQHRVHCDGQR